MKDIISKADTLLNAVQTSIVDKFPMTSFQHSHVMGELHKMVYDEINWAMSVGDSGVDWSQLHDYVGLKAMKLSTLEADLRQTCRVN